MLSNTVSPGKYLNSVCKLFAQRILHQLTSIAFDMRCVLHFFRSVQSGGMMGNGNIIAIVFTVSVIALLATGGIMSAKQPVVMLRAVHIAASAASYLTAGSRLVGFWFRSDFRHTKHRAFARCFVLNPLLSNTIAACLKRLIR